MTLTTTAPLVAVEAPARAEARPVPVASRGRRNESVRRLPDIVEVWGHDSFPASDPPANW